MTYAEKRELARELRRGGASYSEIQKEIHVAKSTLSLWLRDIKLSDDQRRRLWEKQRESGRQSAHYGGSNEKTYREKRRAYQESGREMALSISDKDFVIGCMLYWAEGSKGKNSVRFSNSDPGMIRVFTRFLRKFFVEDLHACVQCYDGNGLSAQDVKAFWANIVKGPIKVKMKPASKVGRGSKVNKRPYGCCYVQLHKTEVVQKLYGAIQELAGIERPEWLQ